MSSRVWYMVVPLVLLAACAATSPREPPPQDLKVEVTTFIERYLKAIEARNESAIRGSYVADDRFAWIEEGRVRYRTSSEVIAGLATLPVGTPIRTELKDLTVARVGQTGAHAWASFATTIGSPPSGFTFGGAISMTLEKEGGAWRIVGGHSSSPTRR